MPEITEKIRGVPTGATVHALRRVDPRRLQDVLAPFVLVELSSVIGRDPRQATCYLDDPSVSRQHFVVRFAPRRKCFELLDLGSSNGLYVNGVRVHEQVIEPNDVIRAGGQVMLFVQIAEASLRQGIRPHEFAFDGPSDAIRAVNAGLAGLPRGGRALLSSEAGAGKAEAVRQLAARRGPSTRLVTVHGTGLRGSDWEGSLLARLDAFDRDGGAGEVLVHLDEITLAPVAAQERLEFLLRSPTFGGRADVTVVATASTQARTAGGLGLTPGLMARLGPPFLNVRPLRQRRDDIVPTFVEDLRRRGRCAPATATADFIEALLLHSWPGNAAEMRALVDLLAAAGRLEACFDVSDLPGRLLPGAEADPGAATDARSVADALRDAHGNVSEAARRLGLSRRHVYRLVERHGLDPAKWRPAARSVSKPT